MGAGRVFAPDRGSSPYRSAEAASVAHRGSVFLMHTLFTIVDGACYPWLTEPMDSVGARLNSARQARGLSIRAMAQLSTVSSTMVSYIENDRREPTVGMVRRLARALGVSPCWLAFGPDGGRVRRNTTDDTT